MALGLKLLDYLGRAQTIWWLMSLTGIGSLATSIYFGAPSWAIFLTVMVSIAVVPIGAIAWFILKESSWRYPLKVEYQEGSGSFYQEFRVQAPGLGDGQGQLVRIRITGQRIEPIDDVQVKVLTISPNTQAPRGMPFHLHRMNDNTLPHQQSTVFSKDQQEYFDVVQYNKFKMNTGRLEFQRIDGIDGVIPEEPCTIEIGVTGRGVGSQKHRYRVLIDSHNNLRMIHRS